MVIEWREDFSSNGPRCGKRREISLIWGGDSLGFIAANPLAQGPLVHAPVSAAMRSLLERNAPAVLADAGVGSGATVQHVPVGELAQIADSWLLHWSQVWKGESYVIGSPTISKVVVRDSTLVFGGTMSVLRRGRKTPAPFVAEFRSDGRQMVLFSLCRRDGSDVAADCFDADSVGRVVQRNAQKTALMLLMLGLAVGLSSDQPQLTCVTKSEPARAPLANDVEGAGNPIYKYEDCVVSKWLRGHLEQQVRASPEPAAAEGARSGDEAKRVERVWSLVLERGKSIRPAIPRAPVCCPSPPSRRWGGECETITDRGFSDDHWQRL